MLQNRISQLSIFFHLELIGVLFVIGDNNNRINKIYYVKGFETSESGIHNHSRSD